MQDAVIKRILIKLPNVTQAQIFDNGWLDVEELYREAGWAVEYDKPGHGETYPARFEFKRQ